MTHKENLEEEVKFWLNFISHWKDTHNEPIPDRSQLLLENALLKLECYCTTEKKRTLTLKNNNHAVQ